MVIGFVNVFKPAGPTSAQIVARVAASTASTAATANRRRPSRHARSASRRRSCRSRSESDAPDSAARRSTQSLRRARSSSGVRPPRRMRSGRRSRQGAVAKRLGSAARSARLPHLSERSQDAADVLRACITKASGSTNSRAKAKTVERKPRAATIYGLIAARNRSAEQRARMRDRLQRRNLRAHALRRSRCRAWAFPRTWARSCVRRRGRSCSTNRARSMKSPTIRQAASRRARTHHSVSDDRAGPARFRRLSRRPRGAVARKAPPRKHVFVRDSRARWSVSAKRIGALLAPRKVFV